MTSATKLIDDVRCIVVRDEVSEDGVIIEGTNDWFAQAKDGDVWYCDEETAEFETFRGDRPQKPELVSIDGSFKAGRDGDKPGIIFLANPMPGQTYIEEASLGNAEDATQVLAVVFERKYYAPGIGVFLETAPQTGEVVRLVKCNVDPRCALLPH